MTDSLLSRYAGWPIIIGSGLGGLSVALHLNRPCLLIAPSPSPHENRSTALAQGGMAAAISPDDSPESHANDTIQAGAGLCDESIVRAITQAGPHAVETLLKWDVPLARDPKTGSLALHLEAAHSHPRVVYAGGDQSGAFITRALSHRVEQQSDIHKLSGHHLVSFHVEDGLLRGVWTSAGYIPTSCCVLATGSCGGLYRHTTIPLTNRGVGIALAAHAGARLADMEFTQFHPTALKGPETHNRLSLISEAVRGAGATLVLDTHERFTEELAPRDIVSRAIAAKLKEGHNVFLDGRALKNGTFSERFPSITAACHIIGIDPDTQLIPVRPAMHYHMGGIAVDQNGRSSIPGLWACGEVACTGLHGANRLASNSLLEALICGEWVAKDIAAYSPPPSVCTLPKHRPTFLSTEWTLQEDMEKGAGILRNKDGLTHLLEKTLPLASHNACALTTSFIAWAALKRHESRGGHYRDDAPQSDTPQRSSLSLVDLPLNIK
ncbi:L-aspartate oxidase [Saccharibacter sp. 17.LH.SD]|uniref:L-aspartate oxidase n=1 Tax=Saccharibacter sp. 17.LH.SD TaxID=2689393 RepID=UPI00136BB210|nr:L-aspartate oxidase [Saccharibacter sp. 17.LH.SD]MXV44758.1 L-aspartate oxidase [Saccharibacter sp. 17.LH.SD]